MLVKEWRHDVEHQKAPGWQQILYGLICAALNPSGRQIISQLVMKVPKVWHSSTYAEVTTIADDISIVNAFVIILFTQGCVFSILLFSELEGIISG